MKIPKIKQRDITDCGAACLASIAAHYELQLPVARIRQLASTDKKIGGKVWIFAPPTVGKLTIPGLTDAAVTIKITSSTNITSM